MQNSNFFVAVLDDEKSVRQAVARLLTAFGFKVMVFESGSDFLSLCQKNHPDCLVLDLNMPGLNGLEILDYLRQAAMQLPVVILTADDDPAMRARCTAAGAVAYLPKPVDQKPLLEAVKHACGISK